MLLEKKEKENQPHPAGRDLKTRAFCFHDRVTGCWSQEDPQSSEPAGVPMGQGPEPPKHRITLGPGSDLLNPIRQGQAGESTLHRPLPGDCGSWPSAGLLWKLDLSSLLVYLWEVKAIQLCWCVHSHIHSFQQHLPRVALLTSSEKTVFALQGVAGST